MLKAAKYNLIRPAGLSSLFTSYFVNFWTLSGERVKHRQSYGPGVGKDSVITVVQSAGVWQEKNYHSTRSRRNWLHREFFLQTQKSYLELPGAVLQLLVQVASVCHIAGHSWAF